MADIESATETYPHFATQAIHAGQDPDQWKSKAVVPPISLSTTFKQDTPGQPVSKRERERRLFYSIYDSIVQYIMCALCMSVYVHMPYGLLCGEQSSVYLNPFLGFSLFRYCTTTYV